MREKGHSVTNTPSISEPDKCSLIWSSDQFFFVFKLANYFTFFIYLFIYLFHFHCVCPPAHL
ncbi:hypothetical protein I7I48_07480 [Histoplasma ohiense]|nr:hypothetical protein I7I48_07480 [Histoplasma ohiense (nom. inval.)]